MLRQRGEVESTTMIRKSRINQLKASVRSRRRPWMAREAREATRLREPKCVSPCGFFGVVANRSFMYECYH